MYYTVIKHSSHLRTLEKLRKHSPAVRVFYISLVFSNACRVLSQCNTRLRLLYLLNRSYISYRLNVRLISKSKMEHKQNQISLEKIREMHENTTFLLNSTAFSGTQTLSSVHYYFFPRPADPPSQEARRWETKHKG